MVIKIRIKSGHLFDLLVKLNPKKFKRYCAVNTFGWNYLPEEIILEGELLSDELPILPKE